MKKNVCLMYAIALLQGMVFYGPIATLYRRAQGVSISQITLIESVSLILCLLLEIPWGVISDRIGYKRTMTFCCCLYFVSKIVFWQASGFWWFLLERVMLSIVIAGLSGVDTSILYLSCEEGKSQRAFGIYNSLSTIGLLTAAVIFSAFVGKNYKLSGGLTVISYGLSALASLFLTEVRGKTRRNFQYIEFKTIFLKTIGSRYRMALLVAVAFLSEAHQTVTVFLNQLKYEQCGLSPSQIGCVYAGVTLAGLVGLCSFRFTRAAGEKAGGAMLYGAAIASCILLAYTGRAGFSVGGILMLRVSNSLFQPFQMELQNRQVQTENRATELSINAMVIDCTGAGTNLIFGYLAELSLRAAFLLGACFCLLGLCLFLLWHSHREQIS